MLALRLRHLQARRHWTARSQSLSGTHSLVKSSHLAVRGRNEESRTSGEYERELARTRTRTVDSGDTAEADDAPHTCVAMARELDCQRDAPLSFGSSCRLRRATVRSIAALLVRRTTFRCFATRSSLPSADADDLADDLARTWCGESAGEPNDDEVECDAEVLEAKERRDAGMAASKHTKSSPNLFWHHRPREQQTIAVGASLFGTSPTRYSVSAMCALLLASATTGSRILRHYSTKSISAGFARISIFTN